eukprot:GHVS01010249.1.p3 GENE.GHVS01010249.1~~GHVS01010249.1.p3  ORF type:complete len:150 (+),score=26.06 GHVS01010249.1:142-591(+)
MASSEGHTDGAGFPDRQDAMTLQSLQTATPAIPDDVCKYFLNRAGCATDDKTMVRLASLVAQMALEKVVEDARTIAAAHQEETEDSLDDDERPEELDLQSLCDSFLKNGELFVGPNLDVFLDTARLPTENSAQAQRRETTNEETAKAVF